MLRTKGKVEMFYVVQIYEQIYGIGNWYRFLRE